MTVYRKVATILLLALFMTSLAACGGGAAGGTQTLVIVTTLPMTGPLGPFGPLIQTGYMKAINDINASGGLSVGGTKYKVQLTVLDNKSDPNTASQQARTLLLKNNAVALLGAATPALSIPISDIGEQLKRPVVQSITPVQAWLGARPAGWNYSWDMFFDENQMTNLQFQTSALVKTNKRIALFTDTEEDGITMGKLWTQKAPQFGYQIAYHAQFPVGTTNFSSQIAAAQAAKADVLIAQMIPPDAAGLWKQMKSLGYQPKTAFCEKCAASSAWKQILGPLAEGTMTVDWWSPSLGLPETSTFVSNYGKNGITTDVSAIVAANSTARVLLDAIAQANSLDPAAINTALGKINKTYPLGHIQFGTNHAAPVPVVMDQWQGVNMVRVYPATQGSTHMESPIPGLG
ncbi:MAG TPA: ABC transporter substrate-binding protein [Ktedonobacteraceae bacterium]|nr:ABC transporter substrate-binding protein [Ktedonobacteraceae bacterium]